MPYEKKKLKQILIIGKNMGIWLHRKDDVYLKKQNKTHDSNNKKPPVAFSLRLLSVLVTHQTDWPAAFRVRPWDRLLLLLLHRHQVKEESSG